MNYDVIVIGGGIVGLATALQTIEKKPDIKLLLIEKENSVAKHQTGHNSGVIHSGLYYKPGSLKALNCIKGYHMLIDFCTQENIPFELCGKIVVATQNEELPYLENLYNRGNENGLTGLKKIGPEEIKEIEPHCAGVSGIVVPQTGIVDYLKVAQAYQSKIENAGGELRFSEKVIGMKKDGELEVVETTNGTYRTKLVVNCAGLYSDKVSSMTTDTSVKIIPFRGEYYEIKKERQYLVKHLIYPVPDPNFPFLGVHFTRMMKGGVEAGPNAVLAYAREGYKKSDINVSELMESLFYPGFIKVATKYWQTGLGEIYRSYSKSAFTKALQRLIPEITEDDLKPGGAGVRAQACDRQGGLLDDFSITESQRVINVVNAPSPAATSSLAIGDTISTMVLNKRH